jgi:hypothetical protein
MFLLSKASELVLEPTQPPILWLSSAFSPRVKRPEHEVDLASSFRAKFNNTGSYTSILPHYSWRGAQLSKGQLYTIREKVV